MSIMDFFASQGTAVPSTGSSGGDWIDWYLNREGPAGRFKGSRRPRYGIDYLFNGGGSVQSEPSYSSVQSGPRTRQKLQPRTPDVLGPGTGYLFPNIQEPWNNPGPGSYWNAGYNLEIIQE